MNAHAHPRHDGPGHAHHHGHAHAPAGGWRYALAIALNLAIVLAEAAGGWIGHSTALIADAGHNLSDVLGLVLAGGAAWLASRPAAGRRTYGFGKATVLAAVANGLVLVFVSGAIAIEAVHRLYAPEAVSAPLVIAVAAIGIAVNAATALMFAGRSAADLNARGVFLHMAGDAAVSVGVIVAAGLIYVTGAAWLDPLASLLIVGMILYGTWGLLREAIDLALDAAPAGADVDRIHAFLAESTGVTDVHDLHVWAMSTTEMALTAHLVRPDETGAEDFRAALAQALEHEFGVRHATLQIEQSRGDHCPGC
ncbi:MAG TPA: cation diffusion facilitator family transporter [Caulobacteraceae bacterium]|nr:cation diffusion facilitator family transporter [Caulobacteraceae bacterium]